MRIERGVLHGDLKPSNIVMSITGIPMLVDFNLSHSRESNNLVTGGTLPYMAPEQIRVMLLDNAEEERIDHRSDIFSLGVILFELLTGHLPFETPHVEREPFTAAGRMLDVQFESVSALRARLSGLDSGLSELLLRCLSFDPQERPQDIRLVAQEIREHLSWRRRVRGTLRRNRTWFAAACVPIVLAVAATGVWYSQRPPLRDRRFQQGLDAYAQQDFAGAIEVLGEAIAADEKFANAYLARGCVAMRRFELDAFEGWLDFAFQNFTLAMRYGSGPETLNAKAYCLIRKNEFELAARDLEELERSGRISAAAANNLAVCYEKSAIDATEFNEMATVADQHVRTACSLASDNPIPFLNLAILELNQYRNTDGKHIPKDGLTAIKRAISLGYDNTITYYYAAKLAGILAAEEQNDDLIDECLDFLARAVEHGHQLNAATTELPDPFGLVRKHPRFQALLRRKVDQASRTGVDRIIIPDVMSSVNSLADRNAS